MHDRVECICDTRLDLAFLGYWDWLAFVALADGISRAESPLRAGAGSYYKESSTLTRILLGPDLAMPLLCKSKVSLDMMSLWRHA